MKDLLSELAETSLTGSPHLARLIEEQAKETGETTIDVSDRIARQMQDAALSQFGAEFDIRARIDAAGTLVLVQVMTIVETVVDQFREVSLENASRLNPEWKTGQKIAHKLEYDVLETPYGQIRLAEVKVRDASLVAASA